MSLKVQMRRNSWKTVDNCAKLVLKRPLNGRKPDAESLQKPRRTGCTLTVKLNWKAQLIIIVRMFDGDTMVVPHACDATKITYQARDASCSF